MRDSWDKVGPFKLFDQHEDEVTDEVVHLSDQVGDCTAQLICIYKDIAG